MISTNSTLYHKAFQQYLRKGTPPDISIKAWLKAAAHPTTYYIWRTAGDDKVRPEHAANEGKIFAWDNPPATGNPGDAINCRCWAEPYRGAGSVSKPDSGLTVTESGRTVFIHRPDGSIEIRSGGTTAWRNNNPGNMRAGQWAKQHGAIGSAGGFAVFPNEATGTAASKALLTGSSYTGLTIDKAIARRSPSQENDTARLQRDIRNIGGFTGNEVVGKLSSERLDRLVAAIKRTEGWQEGTIRVTRVPS